MKGYTSTELMTPFSPNFTQQATLLSGRQVSPHITTAVGVESALMIPIVKGLEAYPTEYLDTLKAIIGFNINQALATADKRHIYIMKAVAYMADMNDVEAFQMITVAADHLTTVGSKIDSFVELATFNLMNPKPENLKRQGGGSESFLTSRPTALPFLLKVSLRP